MAQIFKKSACFLLLAGVVFTKSALSFNLKSDTSEARNYSNYAYLLLEKNQFDSSIYYFTQAAQIWENYGFWKEHIKCKIGVSKNHIRKRDANSALALLKRLETVTVERVGIQCDELGDIYTLLGYLYSIEEDFDQAVYNTQKGISVLQNLHGETSEKVASAYYTLGLVWYGKGEYDNAIEVFDKTKKLQAQLKGEYYFGLSNTYTMLGTVYQVKNEFERSEYCYLQALKIFKANNADNTADAATCHMHLMSLLNNKGEYYQAIEQGKKVIDIYSALSLSEHPNVANAYGKLGEIYTATGDLEKAKEYLEHALQIFSSRYPGKKSVIGALQYRLGEVFRQTGDIEKAASYSQQGVRLFEETFGELHPEIGAMYEQLAGIYAEQRNAAKALRYYRKAINARERVGKTTSRSDIAALYSAMAHVYMNLQRWTPPHRWIPDGARNIDSAFTYLNLASQTFEQSSQSNVPQEALLLKRYGDAYTLQKDYNRALKEYQKSIDMLAGSKSANIPGLPSFEQSIYKKELLDVVLQKAAVFEKLYSTKKSGDDLKTALYHYGRGIDLVDGIRKQFSYDGSKFYLSEKSASVYGNACRVALALHKATGEARYIEAAFLIADRSKANVLLEKLFDGEAKQFAGIPDSLLQQEKSLLKDIAFYETKIQSASLSLQRGENENVASAVTVEERETTSNPIAGSTRITDNSQEAVFDLKVKHQQLIDVFEHQYPKYYELKYAQYAVTLSDIQRKLASNTALVEYLVDKEAIYAFCLTKDNLVVKTLQNTEKIEAQVDRLSSSLRKYDSDGYLTSGRALYASLLEPLAKSLSSVSALIIIPDGNLSYIPFEVLIKSSGAKKSSPDFTSLPYLISKYEISYSYSAAFYIKMYSDKGNLLSDHHLSSSLKGGFGGGSFAGFAPVFRDSTKNGDFLANRSYVEESGISDVRSITLDGKTFNELKYSEEEVVSIGNTFDNRSLPYQNFLHTSATESNFKQHASTYDILHVATHGFINENNPKFSAILFSQPLAPDAQDDGILHVNETFNLDLHAKLVVLSSCESGLGKLVKGEGMIALTRGLFYAGAKNIIFSLWKVSDKQTYLLMDEFYKQMLNGKSYSSSLRAAKLKMIASKESAFPSKWSGFVLVGE